MCYYGNNTKRIRCNPEREEKVNTELRAVRARSGKTQTQVAREASISEAQYQNIEYGKCEPNVRTAIRIADALGIKSYKGFTKLFR
jgi:DNA-binding XRE family transcriptional regulator